MFEITGKVALITGASSGIGAAIASELLQAGAKGVSVVDINEGLGWEVSAELNKKFGNGRAVFIKTDVSNRRQLEDAFTKTVNVFNQLDIVVNNAAARGERNWEKNIAVNLTGIVTGTILAYEHFLPKYKSSEEGAIINIASMAALYSYPSTPVYSAAKMGVIGITRSLGAKQHYQRTKIKVIAVCPGYTSTNILQDIAAEDLLGDDYYKIQVDMMKLAPIAQPTTAVSRAVVEVIGIGASGSVWIADQNQSPYEVKVLYT
ncbi:15-hydroxyprostaglandin dehydrogenase [NAD(+)]-like isoform X2 [Photinus pyralis]|uniref:15-hydroxyprostaglandin dehydrogenase [NAD(+)]-like isoform X2 n=1 Tax=Photinus pyralis TaxID=7054 RepID=UPI0012677CDF|nr:15-hydroxyprostaglandin dehydrogenase [NAD(+)]-like isoform X2 [Photinus pyralis]